MQTVMAAETQGRKCCMAIQATFWTLFFGACGATYLAWMANAKMIDNGFCG